MFTNRMFNLIVAAILVVVVALTVQQAFATKAIAPETNNHYTQSKEQALHEYQLGERYGVLPEHVDRSSAEQIHREYILGERYGVIPQDAARNKSYRSPLDECSDVGLKYHTQCLKDSQESTRNVIPPANIAAHVSDPTSSILETKRVGSEVYYRLPDGIWVR